MTMMTTVKAIDGSSAAIDDVERFNRDYTRDQRTTKRLAHELTLARAGARRSQQAFYREGVEETRRQEAAQAGKVTAHVGQHDFLKESVLYDPVTCVVPPPETENGATQRKLDSQRETFREARALRIQHSQHSTSYDPITGEMRTFW
jgi:acyl transferase domain-containing protein